MFDAISFDVSTLDSSTSVFCPTESTPPPPPPESKNLTNTHRIATENTFRYSKSEKGLEVGLKDHEIFLIKNDLGSEYLHEFFIPEPHKVFSASYIVLEHRDPNSYERYEGTLTDSGKICDREIIVLYRERLKACEKEIQAIKRGGDRERLKQLEHDRNHYSSFLKSALKKNGEIRDLDDLRECQRTSLFMAIFRTLEKFKSCDEDLYKHFKACMTLGNDPKYDPIMGLTWNTTEVS